jgi:hypothetical protein
MDISGSNGKRTTSFFTYVLNHKFSMAGIAASLPVFFIASSNHLFGLVAPPANSDFNSGSTSNIDSKEDARPLPASQNSQEGSSRTIKDEPNTDSGSFSSQASVNINGQSVSTSSDSANPDQSINKTITTDTGSTNVSIEQHNNTTSDGITHSTSNVNVNSNSSGGNSTSMDVKQHSSGGIPR